MKSQKIILTHAAVFAVGASIALVGKRNSSDPSGAGSAANGRNASSSHAESSSDSMDLSLSSRARRDEAQRSGRNQESSLQRMASIAKMGDPMERQAALMELINRLGPGEFAALADQYKSLEHFGDSQGEFSMILRGWAKADPLGALEYASKQGNSARDTSVVLSAWAGKDAAAAERWALAHHEGDGPNPYMASVIRGIAAYDISHASRLTEAMPRSRERGDAVEAITRALFVQGADAAMAYPASIKDPSLQAGFVDAITRQLAPQDAEKAATWLASFPAADAQNRAARRVGEALANVDVNTAAKWLKQLNPEARAEAARGIIPIMSAGDIAGTAKWVSSLSGTPNYDRMVEEFVWSCDQRSPEQSAAWIQGVSDPQQQTRLYHRMLGNWAQRDAAAVKNWVATNQVPESISLRFNR